MDIGIDDSFIRKVRNDVTEGTSALFLLSSEAVTDRVADAFRGLPPHKLIASNLSFEEEQKLQEVFAG